MHRLFMETSVVQSYNTRSSTSGNFYIRVSNLEIIKKNAFSRIGASLWNEVPSNLRELLSGSLSKSGPLNFGIKNIFPHFLSVKRVWQTYIKKSNLLFSSFLFLLRYEPKLHFGQTEVPDRDQKGKIP